MMLEKPVYLMCLYTPLPREPRLCLCFTVIEYLLLTNLKRTEKKQCYVVQIVNLIPLRSEQISASPQVVAQDYHKLNKTN